MTHQNQTRVKIFDEYEVRDWLGHTKIETTMGYIKDAKHYYLLAPYDWIHHVLKATVEDNTRRIRKEQKRGAFDENPSERMKRTWRDSNPRSAA